MLQRCGKTGVEADLLGVCDMEWVFCVTKVLGDWCFGRFVCVFVTWNVGFVSQRCWKTGV